MKARYYILILILILSSFNSVAFAQDFSISKILLDNSREKRQIKTHIYIPKKDTIHQLMIIAHGFVMNADAYTNLARYYQERNFIVVVLNTETSLNADQNEFALDISFVRKWIKKRSTNSKSVFYNRYSGFSVAVGHSMGGGAALFAGAIDTKLDLIIGLAPAAQSDITKKLDISQPVLFITSIQDRVTPVKEFALPLFNNIASKKKTMVNLKEGNHCYFADPNFWCDMAEMMVSKKVNIKRAQQQETTTQIIDMWLNEMLNNKSEFTETFFQSIKDDKWIIIRN